MSEPLTREAILEAIEQRRRRAEQAPPTWSIPAHEYATDVTFLLAELHHARGNQEHRNALAQMLIDKNDELHAKLTQALLDMQVVEAEIVRLTNALTDAQAEVRRHEREKLEE